MATVVGAFATGIAIYFLFKDDPRTGTENGPPLLFAVLGGSAVSALIWAVSGLLQRDGILGLLVAFGSGAIAAISWRVFFGTYVDVLGAAAIFAWPVGGVIASIIKFYDFKKRAAKHKISW